MEIFLILKKFQKSFSIRIKYQFRDRYNFKTYQKIFQIFFLQSNKIKNNFKTYQK